MSVTVKRAISLPKPLDEKLCELAESLHQTYSGIVRQAVVNYLKQREHFEVRESYAKYYSDKKNLQSDLELADGLSGLSQEEWP
ncbi:ribbon-helix-helix protein, CopG family [Elusimicrobiota bacterium]